MRDYLAKNLEKLEPGLTHLQRPTTKNIEFQCTAIGNEKHRGWIDILVKDRHGGLVVVECKKRKAGAETLGQLLGYIAWVKKWLADFQVPVRGFIVASETSTFLKLAASLVPGIQIQVYEHPDPETMRRVL